MQPFDHTGLAQHLGIETLGRQEQDGKIGGIGWIDILCGDVLFRALDGANQRCSCPVNGLDIGRLGGIDQPLVNLLGKLGIDR